MEPHEGCGGFLRTHWLSHEPGGMNCEQKCNNSYKHTKAIPPFFTKSFSILRIVLSRSMCIFRLMWGLSPSCGVGVEFVSNFLFQNNSLIKLEIVWRGKGAVLSRKRLAGFRGVAGDSVIGI